MLVKDPQEIRKILEETKTIAVVGFSDDPGRGAAYYVPKHMHEAGYRIIPVKDAIPPLETFRKAYPSIW